MDKQRCEGMRRHGGALSFGPPTWYQCTEKPTVMLTVKQGKEKKKTLPACDICWAECISTSGITVIKAKPIVT